MLAIISENVENASINAIPKAMTSKYRSLKIYWVFLFVVFFVLSIVATVQNINEFYNRDVISQIREYREYPVAFPGIAICNMDPFVTNFSISYLASLKRNNADVFDAEEFKGNVANDLDLVNYFNTRHQELQLASIKCSTRTKMLKKM